MKRYVTNVSETQEGNLIGVEVMAQQFDLASNDPSTLPAGWPVLHLERTNVKSGDWIVCVNPEDPTPNYFLVPDRVFGMIFTEQTQEQEDATTATDATDATNGVDPADADATPATTNTTTEPTVSTEPTNTTPAATALATATAPPVVEQNAVIEPTANATTN